MPKIITFASQKGGVGKTTGAVNLSVAFAIGGYSVLLIDLDPQSSVRFSFGLKETGVGVKELFTSPQISNEELIFKTVEHENLDFILSNISTVQAEKEINSYIGSPDVLHVILEERVKDYDIVIIDAPASTNQLALNAIYAANLIILPSQCEKLAIDSLKRFIRLFRELQVRYPERDLKLAGILLTQFDRDNEVHQHTSALLYASLSDAIFQSIIPRDSYLTEASALGKSVINHRIDSIGATAYIALMNELLVRFDL